MVEATYTVTEKQFTEAAAAYCKPIARKYPGYIWLQIALGSFVGLTFATTLSNPVWLNVALLTTLLAVFVTQQWRKKAVPVYQASAYAEYNEQVSVQFDEEGVHTEKSGRSKAWMAWPLFTGWMETEHMFIVGMGLSWIPVPKAAFSSLQQDELRTLFISRIVTRP
jgi:hypothetical protein